MFDHLFQGEWQDPLRKMYDDLGPDPGFSFADFAAHIGRRSGWEYVGPRDLAPLPPQRTIDIPLVLVEDEPKMLEP